VARVTVLKQGEVATLLTKCDFHEVRSRGTHRHFRNPDTRCTTVPFLAGRVDSPILLRQIARDIGMDGEAFDGKL
jgi:predicted RNA binding protein YcfA (HicA-like mRNA interferase family)